MTFDKKLNFKKHVEDLYKKANQKVNRCTGYIRDEGTPRYIWTSTKEKSQGTLGTEGTRVHQVTDGHLQRTKVSRYTGYITDEGTPRYSWTSLKDKSLQVHRVQNGRGYTNVQMDICKG